MQKIDKSNILSADYKNWLDGLNGANHPKYSSSNFKYYQDIKMSLLYCQKGLCAYSEKLLCDTKFFAKENWDNGKYSKTLTSEEQNAIKGDLEHFDESLKEYKAYDWDNLFIADTHINCRVKGTKSVFNILKPDLESYDPYKYLQYDFDTGIFFPNIKLSDKEENEVKSMIEILGINCVSYERKKLLNLFKDRFDLGLEVEPYEYITAWNMYLSTLN